MSMICVDNLCKAFGSLSVLEHVNLTVEAGERIAIIGPSGCGKSVFLRCLDLLEQPDSGTIRIGEDEITAKGADINRIRKGMGMVYQGFNLFEHMNVLDNITLAPRKLKKIPRVQSEAQALELLRMVGLENKQYEMPSVLSGGQKQRIAIARCLAMEPKVMLFDEPTSALDPSMVGEVLATIRLLTKQNLTMIIVTHEMNFAREVASRVLFFEDHGIYEQGTPAEIFDTPKKQKTITFIRKLKFFSEQIDSRTFDLMRIRGGILAFAEKYGISGKAGYRLQLCAEELIYEMIGSCYEKDSSIDLNLSIEYSESAKDVVLFFDCGGRSYNPFSAPDDENHMGVTIIRRSATQYQHDYDSGRNRILVRLS